MTGTEFHHLTEFKGCKHLITGLINNHIETLTRTELAKYSGSQKAQNIKLERIEVSRQTIKTKITKLANFLLSHQQSRLAKKNT